MRGCLAADAKMSTKTYCHAAPHFHYRGCLAFIFKENCFTRTEPDSAFTGYKRMKLLTHVHDACLSIRDQQKICCNRRMNKRSLVKSYKIRKDKDMPRRPRLWKKNSMMYWSGAVKIYPFITKNMVGTLQPMKRGSSLLQRHSGWTYW